MSPFCIFWHTFNWLEFVTFIIIPWSIISIVLTYIFFNYRLIRISLESNEQLLEELDEECNLEFKKISLKVFNKNIFLNNSKIKINKGKEKN